MNRTRLLCVLLCLSLMTLSGCSTGIIKDDSTPAVTLAPIPAGAIPRNMDGMTWDTQVPLVLPSLDGQRLITIYRPMTLDRSKLNAQQVV